MVLSSTGIKYKVAKITLGWHIVHSVNVNVGKLLLLPLWKMLYTLQFRNCPILLSMLCNMKHFF